jgi:hypothetical protein
LDSLSTRGFACDSDRLDSPPRFSQLLTDQAMALETGGGEATVGQLSQAAPTHTAKVAIESDFEFYSLFNNTTNAINYVAQLIGYDSAVVYLPELSTSLEVSSISLWTTSADPWAATDTMCGLLEFGHYWNKNHPFDPAQRTIAHFLSGKGLGGGVAWIGELCGGAFSYPTSSCPTIPNDGVPAGGGYGFTANIGGNFDANNPTAMWDDISTAHEIGHNFGSPHSHCYGGIGGNSNPIDACWSGESGCYSGSTSLPGPNSLTGTGHGTIMSYCHQIGGYGAIAMTFGSAPGFTDGILPAREASYMRTFVNNATCMSPAGPAITSVSPASGSFGGGQLVTISGSGFVAGATLSFGGSPAIGVIVVNSATITATTPAHAVGAVTVRVSNPAVAGLTNGNAILLGGYQYTSSPPAPVVTSLGPASGPLAGGTTVTVHGNDFENGAKVTFAGAGQVSATFVNSGTLTVTTPANTAGIKSVTVTNPDGGTATVSNGYFYANPSGTLQFYTLTACRLVDTRSAAGLLGGPALAANATRVFTVTGACGVPSDAKALSVNVTAVSPAAAGFAALYPGNSFPLGTSTVSFKAGATRASNAIVELATDATGRLGAQNASSGALNVLIDVNGYFK